MDEDRITICDMIIQMISKNQLSLEDEARIRKMLEEKQRKQEYRCIADVIESEVMRKIESKDITIKKACQSVYRKCFMETQIGNMELAELTEKNISEFGRKVRNSFGLDKNEKIFFMAMLQTGLNKLSEDGHLNFIPDKDMYKRFIESGCSICYIDNPYSNEETESIMTWAEKHPADVRGIALSLWFAKGISLTEIVGLTKQDCWGGKRTEDSTMKFRENLFKSSIRSKIVWRSLNLHPKDVKEVFVIPNEDGSGWKKLTEWGLQRKLWYICKDLEISYKRIYKDEAIKL